jgi:hypothetical protein
MKQIIEGFRYDTEKAIEVGEASVGYAGDFSAWEATLYKSPRAGRFFLAGSGGPMTAWSRKVDSNSWTGGKGIIPLTNEDALAWAEEHLDADDVEEHFADSIKDA